MIADGRLGRILVTGATGRIGRRLVAELIGQGHQVAVLTRSVDAARRLWPDQATEARVGDLIDPTSLVSVCADIDTLFHLASHSPGPDEPDLYEVPAHWSVTAEGTANLMARVADSGIRRIVYLSSIKAMGDAAGAQGRPADESVTAVPDSLYGRAKLTAEASVLAVGCGGDRHATVLRLPMVYGLDLGNLARMVRAIAARRFPPWPRIANHRVAIHVDDAIAAAILVAAHPSAAGQVYLVTDGRDYSTRWIYEQTCLALGRPVPRWAIPAPVLWAAAAFGDLAERLTRRRMPLTLEGLAKLTGDAWFSSVKLERDLGFRPRHCMEREIQRLALTQ